jgi:hypothetical protein
MFDVEKFSEIAKSSKYPPFNLSQDDPSKDQVIFPLMEYRSDGHATGVWEIHFTSPIGNWMIDFTDRTTEEELREKIHEAEASLDALQEVPA